MSVKKNRSLFLIPIAALVLFLLLGCAPCCCWYPPGLLNNNNFNTTTGNVKGSCYLITNEGKKPVGSMSITIGSKEIISNTDGSFEMTGLNPGTYDIRVSGGDLGYTGKVTVRAGETTELGGLQLHGTLPPPKNSAPTLPGT